jgi:hypothetical protein
MDACIICFVEEGGYRTLRACNRCHTKICIQCSRNDCKVLCPICDREQLNTPVRCIHCLTLFHLKDGLMCQACSKMTCYTCFGKGLHEICGNCKQCNKAIVYGHDNMSCWSCARTYCCDAPHCVNECMVECGGCNRVVCISCEENCRNCA